MNTSIGEFARMPPSDMHFGEQLNNSSSSSHSLGVSLGVETPPSEPQNARSDGGMFGSNALITPQHDRKMLHPTNYFDTPDALTHHLRDNSSAFGVQPNWKGATEEMSLNDFSCTTCHTVTNNGVALFACSHRVCQECAAHNRHESGVEKLLSPVPPKCSVCGSGKTTNFSGTVFNYSTPIKNDETQLSHHFGQVSPVASSVIHPNTNGAAFAPSHVDYNWREQLQQPPPPMQDKPPTSAHDTRSLWSDDNSANRSMSSRFNFNSTQLSDNAFVPFFDENILTPPPPPLASVPTTPKEVMANMSAMNLSTVSTVIQPILTQPPPAHTLPPPPTVTAAMFPGNGVCHLCCDANERIEFFCLPCAISLCQGCALDHPMSRDGRAHAVVTLQQLHVIVTGWIAENGIYNAGNTMVPSLDQMSASGESSPRAQSVCSVHEGGKVVCICDTCPSLGLCTLCLAAHPDQHHIIPRGDIREALTQLTAETREYEKKCHTTMEEVRKAMGKLNKMSLNATKSIRTEMLRQQAALETRTKHLLSKADIAKKVKKKGLEAQATLIGQKRVTLETALTEVDEVLNNKEMDEASLHEAFNKLVRLQLEENFAEAVSAVVEDERIIFVPPDNDILTLNSQLGALDLGPNAYASSVVLPECKVASCDRHFAIILNLCDATGDPCYNPVRYLNDVDVKVVVYSPEDTIVECTQPSLVSGGSVSIRFTPTLEGTYSINVTVRGVPLRGCPAKYEAKRGRDYNEIARQGPLFSFGKEGSGDGELCRPWGICVDLLGRVLIADRSNNRIQVFDKDGNFLSKFGVFGNGDGQFDRPAGVTVNTHNHIIVADKDNHRVQVFEADGRFLRKFGERGRLVGLFNYPWDVATNSQNVIAVSDTRNHRVQMFTETGTYLRKCGFDSSYFFKNLDSPRGLCYMPDSQLLITDFNNHRLALLSPRNSTEMKVYGAEGDGCGRFERPQGITMDHEGRILVCDSKNNRIQVFASDDMRYIASFGLGPNDPSNGINAEMCQWQQQAGPFAGPGFQPSPAPLVPSPRQLLDRPTDVAVGPDGRVYVIDFGNNCVRVF